MKFHDELNSKLWNGEELKSEVADKLDEIATAFIEYLNIPLDSIEDIRITGSSANYNYTPQSDLDLHLIVDYEKVHEDCPIVEGYLWSMKAQFNKDHDISIYGVPVELYAEDSRQPAMSNGVYSLVDREWIKFPEKIEPTDNDAAVQAKYQELKEASERIEDSEVAEELLDKIYAMRKAGLADGGEFSTENMAFKLLRNDGVIDKLKQMKKEKIDKELTLESMLYERDKSAYLGSEKDKSYIRNFFNLHKDLITSSPSPYQGERSLVGVLTYLGSTDGMSAQVQTPIEVITFNRRNLMHLLDENEPERLQYLSKIKATLENPNLIIETTDANTKHNYIKAFSNDTLLQAQLVVVKVAQDGAFYVTTFKLRDRKFRDHLIEGQVIYDLSDTYANESLNSSYTNIISKRYGKINTFVESHGHICLKLRKGKNNYGFAGIRNNELYTDYSSNDCTKFNSMEEAKPVIDRYVKAGFTVTMLGTGKFSYLNDAKKYKFESKYKGENMNLKDLREALQGLTNSMTKQVNEMKNGEHEYIAPFFHGFYESMHLDTNDIEYKLFDNPSSLPEEFVDWCVSECEVADGYYDMIGKEYLDIIDAHMDQYIPAWGKSQFVEVESPKYYNFATDDVVGKIDITEELNKQIVEYLNNNKEAFKKWVKDNHSSYDGFTSFYSNDSDEWMSLDDFDHNELGSIIGFILENEEGDEIGWRLNEETWESTGGTQWEVDMDELNKEFNFVPKLESLYDVDNYEYNEETNTFEWAQETPGQLKLQLESRKIKSPLKKIDETFDYKEMNKKVDEYIKQNNLSPTFEIDTFDKNSEEWKKLREVGIKVSENSPIKLRVENTYFDYGQKWMWTTLIAVEEKADNTSTWQAINPSQQAAILAGYGDEVAQDLIDKYNKKYNENEMHEGFKKLTKTEQEIEKILQQNGFKTSEVHKDPNKSVELWYVKKDVKLDGSQFEMGTKVVGKNFKEILKKVEDIFNKNESTNVKSSLNKINELKDETVNKVAAKRLDNEAKAYDKMRNVMDRDKAFKAGKFYPEEKEYAKAVRKKRNNSELLKGHYKKKYGESIEQLTRQLRKFNEEYGLPEDIEAQVKAKLDEYISKHGDSFEIYVDYRDTLDKSSIKKIFESDHPAEYYYDYIGDWDWWESADYEYDEILKQLGLPEEIVEEHRVEILDMIRDRIVYEIPYDHYNETVGFDVFLNNPEEANIEYGAELIDYNEDGTVYGFNGEIVKLLQLQGYTEEDLVTYVNDKQSGNKFFDSILVEIENCTYDTGNQIVFLVQAPILDMARAIEDKGTITIPAGAVCGLHNAGNGSGSMLEIELEKDITGAIVDMTKPSYQPREGVFEVFYKDGYRYNVDEVYGLVASAWFNNVEFAQPQKEEKQESLKLNKSKKIREDKESDLSRIADRLEDGFYSGNYPDWGEVDINGTPISELIKTYESKINEDKSGYLNDDEIASFYNDFTIESIDNIEKKSSIWNGEENFYYIGDIVIKFPNADVDYDEFSHEETYDNFIAHSEDGTKVAFDRWYPATVYDKLASEVTKAIQAKFPVEEKDIEGIMQVGSKGDKVYRDNKTGKYFIARNGKEHPAYGMTFDNEEDLLMWAGEVGLTESLNREDIKFFEGELLYGYPEGSGRIELGMTVDMVDSICTVGSNDAAVEAVKQDPKIRQQLDEIPEEYLDDLYYVLDMNRTEFDALTRDELESYAVWLAAWDIRESEEYAGVFESEEK